MARVNAATWMADLLPSISKKKLSEIFIPGSHDSPMTIGCLSLSSDPDVPGPPTDWGPDADDSFTNLPFGGIVMAIVRNWAVTQTLNLSDQLHAGIRYFDFRIAKIGDEFKFTHSLQSNLDITKMLEPVSKFMREHTREVLILHCQHFHKMNNEYDKLMGVFESLFPNMLAKSDMVQSSQFGDFVSSGKRVVLIWGDGAVGSLTDKTFVCDQWAVLDSPWRPERMRSRELLEEFLRETQRSRPSADPRLSVVQCILDCDDLRSRPWEFVTRQSLLAYESGLNSHLMEVVLPELGKSNGFIYMMDNVNNPDSQAIERVITLNEKVGNGLQGFNDLVKSAGLDGSWVACRTGVLKHYVGFSGDSACLGPNAHFIAGEGPMSFSANYIPLGHQVGRMSFPPNDSICGIVLGVVVYDIWTDGTTGWWRLIKNPLGQPNVEVEVMSELSRGTSWEIGVWYLDTSGGKGIKPEFSDIGLDGSWVTTPGGASHNIGFSGDRALLGDNVRSVGIRPHDSALPLATPGSIFGPYEKTLRFPPDRSTSGLILCARLYNLSQSNGMWKLTGNPLGQTSMEVQFFSHPVLEEARWELEVWYLPL